MCRVLLLICGLAAHATAAVFSLENRGATTFDPNTGLEWLDLSATAGRSYTEILNGWGNFTSTQRYRFATHDEVMQLFYHAGATMIGFPETPMPENLGPATLTLSLLGTTLSDAEMSRSWMYYDPQTEPTLPTLEHAPCAVYGRGVIRSGYTEEGFFMVPGLFPTRDYASPEIASALVRSVPEPSALTFAALLMASWLVRAKSGRA